MNQLIIIGNLTRDPETGTTESGVGWCRFTVAVQRRRHRDGEPEAEFVSVTAWRALGDNCAKYLAKGRKVCVTGEARAHAWEGQQGPRGEIQITADNVEFLSGGGGRQAPTDADAPPARSEDGEKQAPAQQDGQQVGYTEAMSFTPVETDELPF